jgi:hypothetical protein
MEETFTASIADVSHMLTGILVGGKWIVTQTQHRLGQASYHKGRIPHHEESISGAKVSARGLSRSAQSYRFTHFVLSAISQLLDIRSWASDALDPQPLAADPVFILS